MPKGTWNLPPGCTIRDIENGAIDEIEEEIQEKLEKAKVKCQKEKLSNIHMLRKRL